VARDGGGADVVPAKLKFSRCRFHRRGRRKGDAPVRVLGRELLGARGLDGVNPRCKIVSFGFNSLIDGWQGDKPGIGSLPWRFKKAEYAPTNFCDCPNRQSVICLLSMCVSQFQPSHSQNSFNPILHAQIRMSSISRISRFRRNHHPIHQSIQRVQIDPA
jgi:hypothetical protein